ECIWAAHEAGFQPATGTSQERVIGGANKKVQHQTRGGTRENTTVIVTIGADGSSLPPAVIFKGQAYQTSVGHSMKGWTDGEIGAIWIQHFDKQTRAKANGHMRLLIVDGHNSHYTHDFLRYAREHNIMVLCYPAHTTHVYQGLDVVVFSVLKRYWSEERDRWEREHGGTVNKKNFLAVYGAAHIRALTPDIIKSAFEKTGVCPFAPGRIKSSALAPSLETSTQATLPVVLSTPIR
ncbi:DDE-domain-containing protein, partial [Athelia psychrophila]